MKLQELNETISKTFKEELRKFFRDHKISLISMEGDEDNVTVEGLQYVTIGTNEEIYFKIVGEYDEELGEIGGKVYVQESVRAKEMQYQGKIPVTDSDSFSRELSKYVTAIGKRLKKEYADGLRDYIQKGGRGMMPGAVHKDYKNQ